MKQVTKSKSLENTILTERTTLRKQSTLRTPNQPQSTKHIEMAF